MRLIISVDALRPPLTGIGRYTWELVSRIRQLPDITQLRFFRNGRWITEPARLLAPSAAEPAAADAGSLNAGPTASPLVRWARGLYWDTTCRFNVFHSPNYFLPAYARNGVVTVHDLSVLKFPEAHPIERVRQFERSFKQTLAIASQLITDSEFTRQEVMTELGWPADRVTAVPLGVSVDYRPRTPEQTAPVLAMHGLTPQAYTLCVSTIEPRKRIDALLAAYRGLPPGLRRAQPLVLVGGKGWHADDLHDAIEAAQAEGWMRYLGFVPAADLPLVYAGARLFAYPSVYEGFGLPVAEAMASGVPVLTSDRSCLPEVSGGAALTVDPDDTEAMTLALEAGLTDDAWRGAAAAAGLQVARRYAWEGCVAATMAVYRSALRV